MPRRILRSIYPAVPTKGWVPPPVTTTTSTTTTTTDNNKLLIINWIILGRRGVRWPRGAGLRLRRCADLVTFMLRAREQPMDLCPPSYGLQLGSIMPT